MTKKEQPRDPGQRYQVMVKQDKNYLAALRKSAEKIIKDREGEDLPKPAETDLLRLLHELDIHQIELERQNEELRRTKGELEASRNEYFSLYDSAPVAFVSIDAGETITRFNRSAREIFDPALLRLDRLFIRLIHPDDRHIYFAYLKDRRQGKPGSCELRIFGKNGQAVYVLMDATGGSNRTDGSSSWNFAFTDITSPKEAEATLNAVLDTLPAGVIIADAAGRIVRANNATRELWGVPPETDSWEDYGDWVGWWPDTGERIKAGEWAMTRALLHGEVTRNELVQNQRFNSHERRYFLNYE